VTGSLIATFEPDNGTVDIARAAVPGKAGIYILMENGKVSSLLLK
jgi:hypothetical protein